MADWSIEGFFKVTALIMDSLASLGAWSSPIYARIMMLDLQFKEDPEAINSMYLDHISIP